MTHEKIPTLADLGIGVGANKNGEVGKKPLSPLLQAQVDLILKELSEKLPVENFKSNFEEAIKSFLATVGEEGSIPFAKVTSVHAGPQEGSVVFDFEITPTQPLRVIDGSKLAFGSMSRSSNNFMDYFEDQIDYPNGVAYNPLPINTCWWYISSVFLNGIINYVEIEEAYLMDRYHERAEDISDRLSRVTYQEPPRSLKWKHFEGPVTKQEVFDIVTQPGRMTHTEMGLFGDDILMLAVAKTSEANAKPMYYFFWFDQDVSDCGIGRFQTDDDIEVVKEKFREYVRTREYKSQQLPNHFFASWISF